MFGVFRFKLKNISIKISAVLSAVLAITLILPALALASAQMGWGDGVLVADKTGTPYNMVQMMPDSKGDLYLRWAKSDLASMESSYEESTKEEYLQKLGSDGSKLWPEPVMFGTRSTYSGNEQALAVDDGVVTVWTDNRNKRKPDIFAQKIGADGKKLWGDNGIPVYVGAGTQDIRNIFADNSGGVIVVWFDDERPGLYMQKIGSSGKAQWQEEGVSINDLLGIESGSGWPNMGQRPGDWINIEADGQGGLYLSWNDFKEMFYSGIEAEQNQRQDGNIFLQRVDGNGKKLWSSNFKIALKNVSFSPYSANQLTVLEDGSVVMNWSIPVGNAMIMRQTSPNGSSGYPNPNTDYFVARVLPDGTSAWDYSKPLFQMSGNTQSKLTSQYNSIFPVPVKGGVLFFKDSMVLIDEERVVNVPGGQKQTVQSSKPISQSTTITKYDFDKNIVWSKQMKSNNVGYSPVVSYMFGSNKNRNAAADSFFLQTYKIDTTEMAQRQIRVGKFSSENGNELWQSGGITVDIGDEASPGSTFPSIELDNQGGLFVAWRVGYDPKPSPTTPSTTSGSPMVLGMTSDENGNPLPQYQQSKIYVQHIIDDGSEWSDLPVNDWSYDHVQNLLKMSAISGYGNGEFRPDNAISRAEFTKMVVLALNIRSEDSNGKQVASRVKGSDAEGHWSEQYIKTALSNGTVQGYTDGTFKPNARITRAEATAIICRAKVIKANTETNTNDQDFKDVTKGFWAFGSIEAIYDLGAIKGYGDGTFRPSNPLTRSESAKMIDLVANTSK